MSANDNEIATADLFDYFEERLELCSLRLRRYGGRRRFSGPIATVRVFEDNVLVRECLEGAGEGRVLVVDGGGSERCALLGDLLAAAGVSNGWAGVVINGCVRDSNALASMPFGVAASATCPRKSRKEGTGAVAVPVAFGGVTFHPGQWVYVDDDGIALSEEKLVLP